MASMEINLAVRKNQASERVRLLYNVNDWPHIYSIDTHNASIVNKFINSAAKVAMCHYCSLDMQTFQAVIMGPSEQILGGSSGWAAYNSKQSEIRSAFAFFI